jgi:thiol-disulfide isomerase/thioredoxin
MNFFKDIETFIKVNKKMVIFVILILVINNIILVKLVIPSQKKITDGYTNTSSDKNKLTLYYASWCGWSKKFLPIWEEFKKNNTANIEIETIECTDGNEKCARVQGFPSIILHKTDGSEVEFQNERTVAGLTQFVTSNS